MKLFNLGLAVGAAAALSVPAAAETLRVSGVYPAGNDDAAALDSIAIEQFGGEDGADLALRIEDALRSARVEGSPWFAIVPGSLATDAEAALRGFVRTRTDTRRDGDKEVSQCVKRDDNRKCIERRKERIPCDRMTVRVAPSLRLTARDGDIVHSDNAEVTKQVRFCADEDQPYTDPIVDEALDEIASRVRMALAPRQVTQDIRILESRKGMPKDASKQFRNAVRQTKQDEPGACQSFAALEPAIGEHESLLFNLGLCAETIGEFDAAEDYYQRAIAVDGSNNYSSEGLSRLRQRSRADIQLSARTGK